MSLADDREPFDWDIDGDIEPFHGDSNLSHKTSRKKFIWFGQGKSVPLCDMSDDHLLNAWNVSKNEHLFEEMVFRLFSQRIGR